MCSNLCVFVKQQRGAISEESTISSNGIVKKKERLCMDYTYIYVEVPLKDLLITMVCSYLSK